MHIKPLFAFITTVAIFIHGALAVCDPPDDTTPKCETTDGSPLTEDCQTAIEQLGTNNRCLVTNQFGSGCSTITRYNTCKIDACSVGGQGALSDGVNCGGYLQTILNDCSRDGRVGGQLHPKQCNQPYSADRQYRLQFSHN